MKARKVNFTWSQLRERFGADAPVTIRREITFAGFDVPWREARTNRQGIQL